MLCRDGEVAHALAISVFFMGATNNDVLNVVVFFAPHVLMDVAHLLHFTEDDIGFVIKVRNGGGGAKVAFRIC